MGIGNKFLTRALIGLVIGMMIGVFFWIVSGRPLGRSDNTALVLHLVVSGLFGVISMGGAVVYEIENWGLLKATLSHYIACMAAFSLASVLLNWFREIQSFVIMCIIMTVIYAGIWVIESLYWKKTINGLNEQLNNIHR